MPTPNSNNPDDTSPTDTSGGEQGKEGNSPKPVAPIALTSEQLASRLDRAKESALKDLYKDLGVTSAQEVKDLIKAKQALEAEKLSDKEKLERALADKEAELVSYKAVLERDRVEREAEAEQARLSTAATKAGVNEDDLDVVLPKLEKFIKNDLKGATPTKDDLNGFFADLKKSRPVLFKVTNENANSSKAPAATPKAGTTPANGTVVPKTMQEIMAMPKAEYDAYRKQFPR